MRKRRHRIWVEGQDSHLPPDLQPLHRIPQEPPQEQWLDIQEWHLWIFALVDGGSLRKNGPRDLQIEGVYTVVGFTIGQQIAQQGKRLGRFKWLEQK